MNPVTDNVEKARKVFGQVPPPTDQMDRFGFRVTSIDDLLSSVKDITSSLREMMGYYDMPEGTGYTKDQLYSLIKGGFSTLKLFRDAILNHPDYENYCQSKVDLLIKSSFFLFDLIKGELGTIIDADMPIILKKIFEMFLIQYGLQHEDQDKNERYSFTILDAIINIAMSHDSRAVFSWALDFIYPHKGSMKLISKLQFSGITVLVRSSKGILRISYMRLREFPDFPFPSNMLNLIQRFVAIRESNGRPEPEKYLSVMAFSKACYDECSIDTLVGFKPASAVISDDVVSETASDVVSQTASAVVSDTAPAVVSDTVL